MPKLPVQAKHSLNTPIKQVSKQTDEPDYETKMTWRIRLNFAYALFVLVSILNTVAMVGFILTKNPYYAAFVSPTALVPFMVYLVPMDERRYALKMKEIESKTKIAIAKAQAKAQILANKQRVSP